MKLKMSIAATLGLAAAWLSPVQAHTFEVSAEKNAFLLDGKPMQIRCGELHISRIPRAYWRHRIKMCKAMGLNAVCAYMFWNYHEPEQGTFDFAGEKDIAAFCRIAQEEGVWVVLRPGPYSCGEWEFGGLPWWLLKTPGIRLRSRDPQFLEPAKAYLRRVGRELSAMQITHGGPILMVQDENEYGFFGSDAQYIRELYDTLRDAGFDVPVFTCNPVTQLGKGDIPEVVKLVNFGSNPRNGFAKLRELQPSGPLMCSEYYPAWFDSWGQRHHTKSAKAMLDDIDYMLSVGGSFSLYMAHGGTTFGWWAGCNSPFQPQTSSYDYEAPIDEQGRSTPKFFALRELLKKYMDAAELAALPEPPAPIPLQTFKSGAEAEILAASPSLETSKTLSDPASMETLGRGYGAVSYATDLAGRGGILKAPNVRDQAAVFVDGAFAGFLDRRFPSRGVQIDAGANRLEIIVTHMSRYNFGAAMNNSHKGLLPPVTLGGEPLKGWNFGFVEIPAAANTATPGAALQGRPCVFKRFNVVAPSTADTYLLVRGWTKGHVWVNGHALGRFWGIGPTQTMFVPGCWLNEGENEFLVWDFAGDVPVKGLTFTDTPILDELHPECDFISAPRRDSAPFTPPPSPSLGGEFQDSQAAQEARMPAPRNARRFAFVIDSSWPDEKDLASIAEFDIIDSKGESVSHDKWKFISVSSEETAREDNAAENAIDGQISNFWHSKWSGGRAQAPHYLVIDMGENVDVAAFRYTPRQNMRNGRVRKWRFYLFD